MKRKLIKQANQAYTVTLPINWIRNHGLESGMEINVEEVEDKILISTDAKIEKKKIELKLTTDLPQFTFQSLNVLYGVGYDHIKVLLSNKKQKQCVINAVETRLLGFEVTEDKDDYLLVENLTEPSAEKQEILLRKMFYIINETINITKSDLEQAKFNNLQDIVLLTAKLTKYKNFCCRNVSKKRFSEERVTYHWQLYLQLGFLQHAVWHFYESLDKHKLKKSFKSLKEIAKTLQEQYRRLHYGFYANDIEEIRAVSEFLHKYLYEHIDKKIMSAKGTETLFLHYLADICRQISLLTIPVSSLLLY